MEKEPKIYVRKKFICYLFLCVFIFEKNVERSSNVNRNRIFIIVVNNIVRQVGEGQKHITFGIFKLLYIVEKI